MPKVSVVIPAYNCQRFITTAINSVLAQSYADYELIVVDDGSTDNTSQIVSGFRGRVKLIKQKNGGPAAARNTGVAHSRGEYVAFLDQDDAWLPDKLKAQVELMDGNERLGLVFTDTYEIPDRGFDASAYGAARSFISRPPHRGMALEYLFLKNFISTSSVMVRKGILEKIGPFNASLVPVEDYDRWLRIAALYEIDFLDRPLVRHRDHPATFAKNEIVTLTNIIYTLNGFVFDYPAIKDLLGRKAGETIAFFYVALGKRFLRNMNFGKAYQNFHSAFELTKSPLFVLRNIFLTIVTKPSEILKSLKRRLNTGEKNVET